MAARLMRAAVMLVMILANLLMTSSRVTNRIERRMARYIMTPNTTASTQHTYTHDTTRNHNIVIVDSARLNVPPNTL